LLLVALILIFFYLETSTFWAPLAILFALAHTWCVCVRVISFLQTLALLVAPCVLQWPRFAECCLPRSHTRLIDEQVMPYSGESRISATQFNFSATTDCRSYIPFFSCVLSNS
ncbi:hypothetical protein HHX47_DHR8000499, partial [Lentinula edodes]